MNFMNNSYTERFDVITNTQKHFTTFSSPPLPMPAGAHAILFSLFRIYLISQTLVIGFIITSFPDHKYPTSLLEY